MDIRPAKPKVTERFTESCAPHRLNWSALNRSWQLELLQFYCFMLGTTHAWKKLHTHDSECNTDCHIQNHENGKTTMVTKRLKGECLRKPIHTGYRLIRTDRDYSLKWVIAEFSTLNSSEGTEAVSVSLRGQLAPVNPNGNTTHSQTLPHSPPCSYADSFSCPLFTSRPWTIK